MVLELHPRAVVGGEDDVGIVRKPEVFDGLEEASGFGIDVFDNDFVRVVRVRVIQFIRHIEWQVWHAMWQVDEEWGFFVGGNEFDGLVRVASGDGALVDGELDDGLVFHQWGVPAGECAFWIGPEFVPFAPWFVGVVGVVHVVRIRNAEVGIESLASRQKRGTVTEVPFADASGGVACGLEHIGDRDFIRMQADILFGKDHVARHLDSLGVATGQ